MVLIWGTNCYGQDDGFSRYEDCEQCGYYGRLKTYSTAKFGHLYFIPLLPLGQKRVLSACPSCKMQIELPLSEYKKRKEADLAESFEVLQGSRQEPEKVAQSILNLITYGQFEEFHAAAHVVEREYSREPVVLKALAAVYDYLGDLESGEGLLAQSLELEEAAGDDSAGTRLSLAVNRIKQLKIQEAQKLLSPSLEKGEKDHVGVFYFLVEGLLHKGFHDEALRVLQQIAALDDEFAEDEGHQVYVKKAEAARVSKMAVPSELINRKRGLEPLGRGLPLWLMSALPVSIVLLLVGSYLLTAFSLGAAQTVWLVNGTNHDYTVTINGEDYIATANQGQKLRLPEGVLRYQMKDTVFPSEAKTVEFSTDFVSRPFDDTVFVLNPDGLALVAIQTTHYAQSNRELVADKFKWKTGQRFYQLHGIDYSFEEFPKSVSVKSSRARASRTRVTQAQPNSLLERLSYASEAFGENKEAFQKYFRAYVLLEPHDRQGLGVLANFYLPDKLTEFKKLLAPGLKHRPVLVEWHRAYQDTVESHEPETNLEKEYSELVAKESGNGALKYLLGRASLDKKKAEKLFRESEEGEPLGYGWNALAYDRLCRGEFKEALAFSRRAHKIQRKHLGFYELLKNCALGAGHSDTYLGLLAAERSQQPLNKELVRQTVMAQTHFGRESEAAETQRAYMKSIRGKTHNKEEWNTISQELTASRHYISGNVQAYCQLGEKSKAASPFVIRILRGQLDAALIFLKNPSNTDYRNFLVFYCAAKKAKRFDKEADQALQRAVELMQLGNLEMKMAGAMLGGDEALVKSKLEGLSLPSDYKSLIALSLSFRFPKSAELCRRIATKHNYQFEFPRLVVRQILQR